MQLNEEPTLYLGERKFVTRSRPLSTLNDATKGGRQRLVFERTDQSWRLTTPENPMAALEIAVDELGDIPKIVGVEFITTNEKTKIKMPECSELL